MNDHNESIKRRYPPLSANHPMVTDNTVCYACKKAFVAGSEITLIPLGPGPDPEAQERCRAGRYYNAIAIPIHADCAGLPR